MYWYSLVVVLSYLQIVWGAGSVPNPLPDTCYSGGVMTNPCKGTSCAPCWYQLSDGAWGCFDLNVDGKCEWGTNVAAEVAARGQSGDSPTSTSSSSPTSKNSKDSNHTSPTNTHKYSSTTYVINTVTVSNTTPILTRFNLISLLSTSLLFAIYHLL